MKFLPLSVDEFTALSASPNFPEDIYKTVFKKRLEDSVKIYPSAQAATQHARQADFVLSRAPHQAGAGLTVGDALSSQQRVENALKTGAIAWVITEKIPQTSYGRDQYIVWDLEGSLRAFELPLQESFGFSDCSTYSYILLKK